MASAAVYVTVIFAVHSALPSYSVSVPVQTDQRASCPTGTVCSSWHYCTDKNRASSLPNQVSYITCDYSGSEGVCCIVRGYPRTRRDETYAEKPVNAEEAVTVPSDVAEQPAIAVERPAYEIPQGNLDTSTMTYQEMVNHHFGSFYQDVGREGMVNPPPEVPPRKIQYRPSMKRTSPDLGNPQQATTYIQSTNPEISPSGTLSDLPKRARQPQLNQGNKKKSKGVRQQPAAPKKKPMQPYGPSAGLKGRSKGDDDYEPAEQQSTIASNSPVEQQSESGLKSRPTNRQYGKPKETARNPRRRTKSKNAKYQPRVRSQEGKYTQQQGAKSQSRPRGRKDRNRKEGSDLPQSRKMSRKTSAAESKGEESTASDSETKRRKPANKSGASRPYTGKRTGEGRRQKARNQSRKQNYESEAQGETQQRGSAKSYSRKAKKSKQGGGRRQSQANDDRAQSTSKFSRREGKRQRSQQNEPHSRYGQPQVPGYTNSPDSKYGSREPQVQPQYTNGNSDQEGKLGQSNQPNFNYRQQQEQQQQPQQPQYVSPSAGYSGYQTNQRYNYQNQQPTVPGANVATSDEVTFGTIISHNGPHVDFSQIPNALRHKQGLRSSFAGSESQARPISTYSASSSNYSPNYASQRKQQRKRSARFRDRH